MRPLCVSFIFFLACCGLLPAGPAQNAYQIGRIVLQPDPAYGGRGLDWAKIFPVHPEYKGTGETSLLAVAGDGTCFVLNEIACQIHKFSPSGDLLMSWGKKGRKPGEFSSQPRSLIVLDDRYVLAADTSMGRINVYDLEGKFIKMLNVDFPVQRMVPLENGRFAVASFAAMPNLRIKRFVAIMSLDGSEPKIIASRIEKIERVSAKGKSIWVSANLNRVYSFIEGTREGNLIYGVSDKPELIIYSPEGQQLGKIELNLTSVAISAQEQAEARENFRKKLEQMKPKYGDFEVTETPRAFDGNTPYFTRLMVDAAGNALVFKFSKQDQQRQFQVYEIQGNSGRMIGEAALDSGALGSFKNIGAMVLGRDFLYAITNVENDAEDGWRLVRIPWVGAK